MSNGKTQKISKEISRTNQDLHQQITEAVAGLNYLSETDSEVVAFKGQTADSVCAETLLIQIGYDTCEVEEKGFNAFFAPLIKTQKWFSGDERRMTEKYVALKELLQQNLIEKKVFRLGKIEIDIFVIGLDKDNILRGVHTRAVET